MSRPRRLGAYRRYTYMPEYDLWAEKICHVYIAMPTQRLGDPTEAGHMAIWASPELAVEMVENDGDRMYLRDYFGL